ncbi:MAG: hypothetical protein HY016_13160 [Nitrosomonadales bacterium]|nr:hypothetical protein [Nitrosomonadales bacterium]
MMVTPTLNATRFVQSVSLTLALYFSIIVILSMTMIKPAHASGNVFPIQAPNNVGFLPAYILQFLSVSGTLAEMQAAYNAWLALPTTVCRNQYGPVNCGDISPFSSVVTGPFYTLCPAGYVSGGHDCHLIYPISTCPPHSTGAPATNPTSCTCDDPYVPDPTHSNCILDQYTLSLRIVPGQVEPGKQATVIATVINTVTQKPAAGVAVSIKVDVDAGTGGHAHHDAARPKGSLSGGGSTGPDGTVSFTFMAPEVSGTHTFTAQCDSPTCTNNPVTAKIKVKVDGLELITASPYYALQDSAGKVIGAVKNKHSDNHYLTNAAIKKLKDFAERYNGTVLPGAKLYLNDASLVWGGLFDVGSTPWKSPHTAHDRGRSIDIRAENSGGQYEGAVPFAYFDDTIKAAADAHARAALHCQGSIVTAVCLGIPYNRHFHVDF